MFLIDCHSCRRRTVNGFNVLESAVNNPSGIEVRLRCRCGATVVQHHGDRGRRPVRP